MSKHVYQENYRRAVMYRRVFGTQEGIEVLTDILNDLGFYGQAEGSAEETALRDYAGRLLFKAGVFTSDNRKAITSSLMAVPIPAPPDAGE